MAVSLSKGGNVSLSKEAGGAPIARVTVGLGWDERSTDGASFDLDASAFLLTATGRVRAPTDFVFYNQLKSGCGNVQHMGDNKTGGGDGDDEVVKVNLAGLAPDVTRVAFAVTIHEADTRRQNFGMVTNAFIRIVNDADGKELARFDLGEDFSTETAVIFGELYRHNSEWKFKAVGQGYAGGLGPLATNYGVPIG
jgi:tellurium resistance protein TerD